MPTPTRWAAPPSVTVASTSTALIAALALALALVGAGCGNGVNRGSTASLPDGEDVAVERVVDGDTIKLSDGRRVRLIGVDTPETVDPRRPVECLGAEASAHTEELLPPGTRVRLEFDVERFDRYERTLAYVYRLDDGLFVNLDLARQGFAEQLTVPPNVARADEFADAVATARSERRGLWSGVCADA